VVAAVAAAAVAVAAVAAAAVAAGAPLLRGLGIGAGLGGRSRGCLAVTC